MASTTFGEAQAIPEGSSRLYTTTLLDTAGDPLTVGQVTAIRFSLRDARGAQSIINGRNRQDVLNINGGAVIGGSLFSLVLAPEDTISIGTSRMQKRRALFEVDFVGGHENHEVFFYVANLADVPPAADGAVAPEGIALVDVAQASVA